ncbi:MAG: 50S ribosomal protein L1 [Candidatus Moranbacteria bacterium RIFOXYB1_FULL_44_23]|nr:MAG: 50S ribosomal protein L1 [Candidatus Moranbacteria bacterium RIFOXYA1_FULL_44_7]OGI33303.1 MAG: 50S ribosomal protein L1 [Candidatus Moranbacteria bacterium RIFOXYC1_FULL_44_13]OGI37488.1 MAG: 50S ribosomal protein L1 [Candidatus Moranbacteria bacterium RIFOXYD1_FULL_44_12]OGI39712.1 MAG: 50S ribosomal protein L1 [Candidatus Moranbacteria bacterium RIFOXYB1_FULL_44_23]
MNQSENNQEYPITEAIAEVKKNAKAKFDESIEVHARLAIDPKKSDQQVRGVAELPHGTGKKMKIAVFTTTQKKEAEESGADIVGGEELIDKIKSSGKIDTDIAIATPEMMPRLATIAKILGPKGLMPNPKNKTVTQKVKEIIESLKHGRADFKNDDSGNVHQVIGKKSFEDMKLEENFKAFMDALRKSKPEAAKGKFIKGVSICSTMGKSVKISL